MRSKSFEQVGALALTSWVVAAACLLSGCSSVETITDPARHPVAGEWLLEIDSTDVGHAQVPVLLEVTGDRFEAHSPAGSARRLFGLWKYLLARSFTSYFERGALMHLKEGRIEIRDRTWIHADLTSITGSLRFSGTVDGDRLEGTLTRGSRVVAVVSGERRESSLPLRDYPALARGVIAEAEAHHYDPKLAQGAAWRDYAAQLEAGAAECRDDADLLFLAYYLRSKLPFSHFHIYAPMRRELPAASESTPAPPPRIGVEEVAPGVAHLRIRSFAGGRDEIDAAFAKILEQGYASLIVDLRGNPGGNVSAMRVASYLVDGPRPGGVFVTRRWFEENDIPPGPDRLASLPRFHDADVALLRAWLAEEPAIALEILPVERRYLGRVMVLTDRRTASSSEPLVYGIKLHELGTIVGERTAGVMLSGEQVPIGDGWMVMLPTADYYAADGYRIDGAGVEPDVHAPSREALERALELLGAK